MPAIDANAINAIAATTGTAPANQMRPTLGMPRGSVRALLALCVAGCAYWLIARNQAVPHDLLAALMIVLGYYFADRAAQHDPAADPGPHPLWLPKGSIRALLIVGFAGAVGYLVYRQRPDNFFALAMSPVILNIGSFMLGRLGKSIIKGFFNRGKTKTASVIGDVKGLVGIAAGVGTVLVYGVPDVVPLDLRARFVELFPALISFYFGSR